MLPTAGRLAALMTAALCVLSVPALTQKKQSSTPEILLDPTKFRDTAPATFRTMFETSAGAFVIEVHREWAPHGADRFYNLVKNGYYTDCRFFRVVKQFVAQFGIHGDPAVNAVWNKEFLQPDRARQSNIRGRVTFAQGTPDTRTTQLFINLGDNSKLDIDHFAPIGEVVTSMLLVERIYAEYGEAPSQDFIQAAGNEYLMQLFPNLSYIKKATIEQ